MVKEITIDKSIKDEEIKNLRAGDQVLLSGTIYTARDMTHRKLINLIRQKKKLPFSLKGQVIYYAGPTPRRPGRIIGSCGPTTSSRMDKYAPELLKRGLKATIGKGTRSIEVREAMKKHRAIYLIATGGAAAYLSKFVKKAEIIAFKELGPEAIWKLEVEKMPLFVGYDLKGNSIYHHLEKH